jgi:AcrR family transcriptional regulator
MSENAVPADSRPRKERKENADRRRGQLIDAALQSIIKNGLPKTTLATVAREAELSQGVAVFYFQTKEKLLAAALDRHYEHYASNWRVARASAPDDAAARLAALVYGDFDPSVCSHEAQIIWHAFWGEASARPAFKDIADRYDTARSEALEVEVKALLTDLGRDLSEARVLSAGIEALTDGLWLQMYLASGITDPKEACVVTRNFLVALFPERDGAFALPSD